jgi:plasmid stability protein
MASITIRQLDDDIKQRLRIRASHHGRSMEDEARVILREVLVDAGVPAHPVELARLLFSRTKGIDLPDRPEFAQRPPPNWGRA